MRREGTTIGRVLLAMTLLALSACSFTKLAYMNAALAYSNATPVLTWLVDDYVDSSGRQRGFVKERIARAMAWHRTQELPEYRRFIEGMIAKTGDGLSIDESREAYLDLRKFYYRAIEHILPDLADLLLRLEPDQVAKLERKFSDDNRKAVKEAPKGPPEERLDKRVDKFLEHIEEFTGELSSSQRQLLREHLKAVPELEAERLGDRRYRQTEILAMIHAQPSRGEAVAKLRQLLIETETWRRPEYIAMLKDRDERVFEMLAALSSTLDSEQRGHLKSRLRGFLRDITELTARAD